MTKCLHMLISVLLTMSDDDLAELLEVYPPSVRITLYQKKAAGELYVSMAGCERFDPVNGCPGR